jgi:hypothetical protein
MPTLLASGPLRTRSLYTRPPTDTAIACRGWKEAVAAAAANSIRGRACTPCPYNQPARGEGSSAAVGQQWGCAVGLMWEGCTHTACAPCRALTQPSPAPPHKGGGESKKAVRWG